MKHFKTDQQTCPGQSFFFLFFSKLEIMKAVYFFLHLSKVVHLIFKKGNIVSISYSRIGSQEPLIIVCTLIDNSSWRGSSHSYCKRKSLQHLYSMYLFAYLNRSCCVRGVHFQEFATYIGQTDG